MKPIEPIRPIEPIEPVEPPEAADSAAAGSAAAESAAADAAAAEPTVPPERGLSCQEFVELVTDYLEGAMSPAERERFEHHLARCPGCDTYLAQIQETAATAGRIEEEHLAEPARSHLLDAFRTWKGG